MTSVIRRGSLDQLGSRSPAGDIYASVERWKAWAPGQTILLTGANAGLGFFSALGLAASGARVIMACRNRERAERAAKRIYQYVPQAELRIEMFDAASLVSAQRLAEQVADEPLDAVIANAGIIHTPQQRIPGELGYDLTMTTNFLSHARLVGALAESFRTRALRFIGVGSMSTLILPSDPANLTLEHRYYPYRAYVQSKAALQSFGLGLDHRLRQIDAAARSITVHPGYSISGLTVQVPGINEPSLAKRWAGHLQSGFAQGKHQGAVNIVEAALNPALLEAARAPYLGPRYISKGACQLAAPARLTRQKKLLDPVWDMFVAANGGVDPLAAN